MSPSVSLKLPHRRPTPRLCRWKRPHRSLKNVAETVAALEHSAWIVAKPVHNVKILSMLTEQIVALLIAERDKLNRAIEALQGPTKRRGRPPKNPLAVTTSAAAPSSPRKRHRRFTAAQRKA